MATMTNPVRGRVTSEWSRNRRNPATGVLTSHAGIDIAAAKGTPIVAAFAGRVISVRTGSYRGDPRHGYGPKTGNHVAIQNSDGAVQYYGHLNTTGCHNGQWIKQGEIIGTVGDTGMVTGAHLHFETWSNKSINSHFNPRVLFKQYGISPGVGGGAGSVKPAGSGKPNTSGAGNSKADNIAIQKALKSHGYYKGVIDGVDGPLMKAAVKAFQKRHKLVVDGHWGPVTQAVWDKATAPKKKPAKKKPAAKRAGNTKRDNKAIQKALKKMGIYKGRIDGVDAALQKAGVKKFQAAHGLVADGAWLTKTQAVFDANKRVQKALRRKGYTKQTVDGYIGNQTTFNLKHYQRNHGLTPDGDQGPITRKHLGIK